jgi:CheY-like chemotaxis protein
MDKGPSAYITANPTQISQALMNLCVNAQDAMDQRGRLNIMVDIVDSSALELPAVQMVDVYPDGNRTRTAPVYINSHGGGRTSMVVGHVVAGQTYARLSVSDTGSGIPRHVMERMFEPFFTTKDVHRGTGLGLAAVHGIVVSHRGVLCVDTTVDQGSSFQMLFPLLSRRARVEEADEDETKDAENDISGRILVIDDHDDVRTTTCMMLQRAGYEVFDSKMPGEALDLIRDNPMHFDLVISDYSMPEMTGVELAHAVTAVAPHLKFVLISGYAEAETRDRIAAVPLIRGVIKKPVTSAELIKQVKAVLAA